MRRDAPADMLDKPTTIDDLSEDDKYLFEERAAIREFDGGLSRQLAEWLALRDVEGARQKNGLTTN